jgi:hypothetical protein
VASSRVGRRIAVWDLVGRAFRDMLKKIAGARQLFD